MLLNEHLFLCLTHFIAGGLQTVFTTTMLLQLSIVLFKMRQNINREVNRWL